MVEAFLGSPLMLLVYITSISKTIYVTLNRYDRCALYETAEIVIRIILGPSISFILVPDSLCEYIHQILHFNIQL